MHEAATQVAELGRRNALLAALPASSLAALLPHAELASLPRGLVLAEEGEALQHALFPLNGVISLVSAMEDGAQSETGTIGREGLVGAEAVLDAPGALGRYVVQVPVEALRLPLARLAGAAAEDPALRGRLLRFVEAFLAQTLRLVACNGRHAVEPRCCRWLLMAHDRARGDGFGLTQQFLAEMLSVRRASAGAVCRRLERRGIIRLGRGRIEVVDRRALEAASCECYPAIRHAFDRLLPGSFA